MINIGIIGPGRVGARHADAIHQTNQARLWSVGGRIQKDVEKWAIQFDAQAHPHSFTDIDKMLADPDLDAVIIATPDKLHTEYILAAIAANKAILVEKPICTELTEIKQISAAMSHHKKPLAVGYHLRWHDGLRQIASRCHNDTFGALQHLRLHWGVDFYGQHKWRTNSQYSQWLCLTVIRHAFDRYCTLVFGTYLR